MLVVLNANTGSTLVERCISIVVLPQNSVSEVSDNGVGCIKEKRSYEDFPAT
jgi:hypothetical protein